MAGASNVQSRVTAYDPDGGALMQDEGEAVFTWVLIYAAIALAILIGFRVGFRGAVST